MPLVVGADTFLGSRLARELARHTPGPVTTVTGPGGGGALEVDLHSDEALAALLARVHGQTVYYCADSAELGGSFPTTVSSGTGRGEWARRIDVAVPRDLARVAGQLIYLSTDRVFAQEGPVHADAEPRPGSPYGDLKLEGERAVLSAAPGALVVRVSAPFDDDGTPTHSFAALHTFEAADNETAAPSYAPDVIRSLLGLVGRGDRGVRHLTGPTRLSDYDLHQLASLRWGFDVTPAVTSRREPMREPVPSPGVRLRAPADVFVPRRTRDARSRAAATRLTVFDCVGVVLGRRTWKEVGDGFWDSQDAWGARTGPLPEADFVADAYGPNPYFWRALRAMPLDQPRVLANNGPLASFGIWERRYGFPQIFDLVINSEREGYSKPSPAFFSQVASVAGAGAITLIDDTEDIVRAARRHGWGAARSTLVSTWPVEEYQWE
ncbi:sugar nucleotide-binding protein [Streptomyces sviceus]|uniref:sugar nucleotide-binding protein n=1 Tax=Streptomyces sviceus TaxID=285530 RepID=UPI00367A303A